MGVAAYNRGTRKIARDIDSDSARAFDWVNDLNRAKKDQFAQVPECTCMKLFYCSHFEVWTIENGRVGFWATERSIWALMRKWHIQIEDFNLNTMTGHVVAI